jgi:hypothetical protein
MGSMIKHRPKAQRWFFGIMCFMTINGLLSAGNWGLTLDSVEHYRGHAKGFHFYFNHILAISLLTARWLEDRSQFRWVPPGMAVYALFLVVCSVSIVNAPRVDYVIMAMHKMTFFALMGLAAFNYLRTIEDIRFFMSVMAGTMIWEAFIVLKLKYLQGQYQVLGTFEHQNPLAMYSIMIGLPMLAVALGPKYKGQGLCVGGYIASAIIIQGALSRASLVLFAVGTVIVTGLSLLEKPTVRRFTVIFTMGAVGSLALAFVLDTIIKRFNDKGNLESAQLRDRLNEAARMMAADYPLGIGWNNYALVINPPYRYAEVINDWTRSRGMRVIDTDLNAPVESHYYLLISENGYGGLVAWYLVMAAGLYRNLRGFIGFKHSFERVLCLGIFVGMGLNYLQGLLERVLTQPRNLMLWFIMYGIIGRLDLIRIARRKKAAAGLPEDDDIPLPSEQMLASAGAGKPAHSPATAWPSPAGRRAARELALTADTEAAGGGPASWSAFAADPGPPGNGSPDDSGSVPKH